MKDMEFGRKKCRGKKARVPTNIGIHWHKHCSKVQGDKEAWKGKKEHGGRALRWTVSIVC